MEVSQVRFSTGFQQAQMEFILEWKCMEICGMDLNWIKFDFWIGTLLNLADERIFRF